MTDEKGDAGEGEQEVKPTHDAYFKSLMQPPQNAGHFLREHLPMGMVELLGPGLPTVMPGSFVDGRLRLQHTDVLLRMHLKDGRDLVPFFLLEHKSENDRLARFQLVRYSVGILDRWYLDDPKAVMPVVVPVLVYNGLTPWTQSTELMDLAGPVPEEMRRHMLSLNHVVVDLSRIPDSALSGDSCLRLGLRLLKHGKRKDLAEHIDEVLAGVFDVPEVAQRDAFEYASARTSRETVRAAMMRIDPDRADKMMNHVMRPYYQEGREEGLKEGLKEGRQEGRKEGAQETLARTVLRVTQKRFPLVSAEICEHIAAADEATLEDWLDRLIDAVSLDQVFGDGQGDAQAGSAAKLRALRQQLQAVLVQMVLDVAENRLPRISTEVRERIAAADAVTLNEWLGRLIVAVSLDEVFGEGQGEAQAGSAAKLRVLRQRLQATLAKLVVDVTATRLPDISTEVRERIAAADAATLNGWLGRLISAESLDEVFGSEA